VTPAKPGSEQPEYRERKQKQSTDNVRLLMGSKPVMRRDLREVMKTHSNMNVKSHGKKSRLNLIPK